MTLKPLILIGFAGSGKSVVGAYVARELGLPFSDIADEMPETADKVNMAGINSLFTLYLTKAAAEGGVIASASSNVLMPKNRRLIKQEFVTVFLDAPFETLYPRITTSGNELAYNYHESELRRMYDMRRGQYIECADFTVDCSLPIDEVASSVAEIALSEGCADLSSIVF